MEQDQQKNNGNLPALLVVGTVGVLLPLMLPSWEWAGIVGWGTALIAYIAAFAVARRRFSNERS